MSVIDDHHALAVLSGRRPRRRSGTVPSISWGFHFRLVRAVLDMRVTGRLSGGVDEPLVRIVMAPPAEVLRVLDPRHLTVTAARLMARYPLSLVGAEFLSAGIVLGVPVHVAEGNVGRSWRQVAEAEAVELRVESV